MAGSRRVDELARLALARDQVVAAPGDQLAVAEPQQVEADGVVLLEAGEEPAVGAGLGQGVLDVGDAFGQHVRRDIRSHSSFAVRGVASRACVAVR